MYQNGKKVSICILTFTDSKNKGVFRIEYAAIKNQHELIAEPTRYARQRSTISFQICSLSNRENSFVKSAYVRPPAQTLGEGNGSPRTTRQRMENTIFSGREIARCPPATGPFLGKKPHDHPHFWKRGFFN